MFDRSGQQIVIVTIIWWWQVRERLAVNKQRSQRFDIERFNLKKLNEVEGKSNIVLSSQIGLQIWKIWMQMWKLVVFGKREERI
jgi:hypothetical protein